MIQAFGLTSIPRKAHPPAVDDVSFEARAGRVTALLGAPRAGKTTALRLMLELQQGRGLSYFRGRPLHRISHPSREVGVLLGDVPGHPARSVRGHLRMLCAAAGVPAWRADEVLEMVGLAGLRGERLGTLSRGMDRRLGLACALLPDPHTLVLDDPAHGLSAREGRWLHDMLRAHATQGGTVLFATADPKEAARTADRVVTLQSGRVVADQEATVFARTRLRPRVAVRSPQAGRLAALLAQEARAARRSVEVVREEGNRLCVYGSTTADVGETAFRHGILVHQLADEVGDMGPGAEPSPAEEKRLANDPAAASDQPHPTEELSANQPQTAGDSGLVDQPQTTGAPDPVNPSQPTADPNLMSRQPSATGDPAKTDQPQTSRDPGPMDKRHTIDEPSAPARQAAPADRLVPGQPHAPDEARTAGRSHAAVRARATDQAQTADGQMADHPPDIATTPRSPARTLPAGEPMPHTRDTRADGCHPPTSIDSPAQSTDTRSTPAPTSTPPTKPEPTATPDRDAPHDQPRPRHTSTTGPRPGSGTVPLSAPASFSPRTPLPPPISVRPTPSPLRPLRYELHRAGGISTGFVTCGAVLVVSALVAVLLARLGHTPQGRLFAAWPQSLPLPPAALGAGLLGALAFGDEFRHPALAADRGTVPRRLGLLAAKLLVSGATATMLAVVTVGCDVELLYVVYGREVAQVPADWLSMSASWLGLVIGCAWAGVLAAGVFRSIAGGLAAVIAVPVVVVPLVQEAFHGPAVRTAAGFPVRMREVFLLQWPFGGERYLVAVADVLAQPVGGALALSLSALLCAYLFTALRRRVR
ncbi:ATP-binding cassette domain-containing protein [Streptomyces sp. NPDC046805]|uniref:ATP-binding cassette domain-containing protein n=1 Tax=Streptomyces sp. NPDC046805 TaxID=3155134 RepID=UPI0033CFE902